MTEWLRPALILGAVMMLITANVIEFRAKRHADASAMSALDDGEPNHARSSLHVLAIAQAVAVPCA